MIMSKSIINALILINIHMMVRGSGLVESLIGHSDTSRNALPLPETRIKNFDEAISVYKILEIKFIDRKVEWVCPETDHYMIFFGLEENKKKLYKGLEIYSGDYYFDSFSKFAYMVLLIKHNFHEKLQSLIDEDMKTFFKSESGISNVGTLRFKNYQFRNCIDFSSCDLYELFFKLEISKVYQGFYGEYKNIEVFLTSFSFILTDQINNFFCNETISIDLVSLTDFIRNYVEILPEGLIFKYNDTEKKFLYDYMRGITDCFKSQLYEFTKKRKYDSICEINFGKLNENVEFRQCLLNLSYDNQQNNIFDKIKLMLENKDELNNEVAGTQQFSGKNYEMIQFFRLCYAKKILKTINAPIIKYKNNDLLLIKMFYQSIGLTGEMFSICDQMFGAFIISTIIMLHQEKKECLKSNVKNAWDLMYKKIEDNTTDENLSLFILSEGYFGLIIEHLNYEYINLIKKSMLECNHGYNMLIQIIFGEYYHGDEKQIIERYLKHITSESLDRDEQGNSSSSSGKNLYTNEKKETLGFSTFKNTDSDSATLDINLCQCEKDKNTCIGKRTNEKVETFCAHLQGHFLKEIMKRRKGNEEKSLNSQMELDLLSIESPRKESEESERKRERGQEEMGLMVEIRKNRRAEDLKKAEMMKKEREKKEKEEKRGDKKKDERDERKKRGDKKKDERDERKKR